MRTHHGMLNAVAKLGLLLIAVAMTSACSKEVGWKEEVLLHDGQKIIVDRSIERGGRHEIGQRGSYSEQHLAFTMPATGRRVTWEDHYSKELGMTNFLPMLLDIRNGVVYLVARPMGCLSYNKWGRPNPPYVIFRYDGKAWQRIPLEELPVDIKTPNMISSAPDIEVEKSGKQFMSAEMVKAIIDRYKNPTSRTILREALHYASDPSRPSDGCPKLVHYRCGWFAIQPDGKFHKEAADVTCNNRERN